jgi:hypothetical protein
MQGAWRDGECGSEGRYQPGVWEMGCIEEDPMTRHAAREHSLEGVPESTGYVLFIPDCYGQSQERGHISDRLSDRRRGWR